MRTLIASLLFLCSLPSLAQVYLYNPTNNPGLPGQQLFSSGVFGYYNWGWGTNAQSSNATVVVASPSIGVTTNGAAYTPFFSAGSSNWVYLLMLQGTNEVTRQVKNVAYTNAVTQTFYNPNTFRDVSIYTATNPITLHQATPTNLSFIAWTNDWDTVVTTNGGHLYGFSPDLTLGKWLAMYDNSFGDIQMWGTEPPVLGLTSIGGGLIPGIQMVVDTFYSHAGLNGYVSSYKDGIQFGSYNKFSDGILLGRNTGLGGEWINFLGVPDGKTSWRLGNNTNENVAILNDLALYNAGGSANSSSTNPGVQFWNMHFGTSVANSSAEIMVPLVSDISLTINLTNAAALATDANGKVIVGTGGGGGTNAVVAGTDIIVVTNGAQYTVNFNTSATNIASLTGTNGGGITFAGTGMSYSNNNGTVTWDSGGINATNTATGATFRSPTNAPTATATNLVATSTAGDTAYMPNIAQNVSATVVLNQVDLRNATNFNYAVQTNNGNGLALVAGSPGTPSTLYLTNITADTTLAAFTLSTTMASGLKIYATCSGGTDRKLVFPNGCVGAGLGTPPSVTVTNAQAAWFDVVCIPAVVTNVFWSPTKF